LDRGKNLKEITFRLTPHGVITGHILDEDGDPVSGVQVQVARSGYSQGRKQLMFSGGASTNDLGEYRIFGIAPGKYFLSATYRNMMAMSNAVDHSTTASPDEEYVPTYYPGTIDPTGAAQVEVAPGATLSGINLKLSKARTVRVRGHVIQSQATGRPMISVTLLPRNTDQISMMMSMSRNRIVDAKGNFEITGVQPGSYYLRAMMNTSGKSFSGSTAVVVGSSNLENVNVTIGSGLTITGRLRVDGPSNESLSNLQLRLMPREPGTMMFSNNQAKLNEDGSFRIEDVGSDVYNLNVFGLPDGFYVKSARMGESEILTSGLDATAGQLAPLEVVLSPNAGQLSGAVTNPTTSQPAPGATVVLIPQEKDRREVFSFYKTVTTDQSGNFSFKNLTPGDYKVYAWEDIEPGAYSDPDFVKPVESKGESVNIKEGSKPAVQLTLIPAEGPPQTNQAPR
jgi:protocatechuate 3,4-dioxygenase beta subunit